MIHKIDEQQLLEGSILPLIIKLALPMIVAFAFQTSYNFLDRYFVSRLGDMATAAIGMAFTIQLFLIAVGSGIGVGINSYIARNLGAGRVDQAVSTALHAFVLALVIGLGLTIGGLLLQRPLFMAMGARGDLLEMILDYLTIILLFAPIVLLSMFLNNVFRGWGDTLYPMVFMVTGTVLNIILDPLLIFGWGPFPRMGIQGAALATGLARVLALVVTLWVLFGKKIPVSLSFRKLRFSWKSVRGIFQVGLPSSVSQFLTSIAMGIVFAILKTFGEEAQAAYTIVFTYEMVAFLPILGVGQAVTILTGHNFGARKLERLKTILYRGVQVAFTMMLLAAIGVALAPRVFAGVFAKSDAVLDMTAQALRISVFGYVFFSFYICIIASFQGLGLGRQYLWANLVRLYVFQLPLILLGSLMFHLIGVWYGMVLGNFLSAGVVTAWFLYLYQKKIVAGKFRAI